MVTGSHPPTLLRQVQRTVREECEIPRDSHILLAVSGGPDSMAMLHSLSQLATELCVSITACGIDHGLRAEAPRELAVAENFAHTLGVAWHTVQLQLSGGGNLQARAREARYAQLEQVRLQIAADYIATAHHTEDRAETVLMRLLRGAPPEGLAVLPARAGTRVRPLLRVTRADIEAHLVRHRVPSSTDPSNSDPRFLRTRIRQELLPLLKELSPRIVSHLSSLADELMAERIPPVLDENGEIVRLGRSQRDQLRRALRYQQRDSRVLLAEGLVLTIDSRTGQPRVKRRTNLEKQPKEEKTEVASSAVANTDVVGVKRPKSG